MAQLSRGDLIVSDTTLNFSITIPGASIEDLKANLKLVLAGFRLRAVDLAGDGLDPDRPTGARRRRRGVGRRR